MYMYIYIYDIYTLHSLAAVLLVKNFRLLLKRVVAGSIPDEVNF
jgi:hypothetical protein